MIPHSYVVAGPGRRVALRTRISCARQDKWPFVRPQFQQTLLRSADILHSKYIVNRQVGQGSSVVHAVAHIERHGFRGRQEYRRLIHIVPEARHAHIRKILVKTAPPKVVPSARFTNTSPFTPLSYGAYPWSGSFLMCKSVISTV